MYLDKIRDTSYFLNFFLMLKKFRKYEVWKLIPYEGENYAKVFLYPTRQLHPYALHVEGYSIGTTQEVFSTPSINTFYLSKYFYNMIF